MMVTLGTDAHKRSHTIVAVDTAGAEIGSVTVAATTDGHLRAASLLARAALREPDLPVAQLDGPSREVQLLVDYRETLVHQRTRLQNQLRWRLHELEPGYDPPAGSLNR
jgi:hypothetical protein